MTRWPYEAVGKKFFGRGLMRTQEWTARGARWNMQESARKSAPNKKRRQKEQYGYVLKFRGDVGPSLDLLLRFGRTEISEASVVIFGGMSLG